MYSIDWFKLQGKLGAIKSWNISKNKKTKNTKAIAITLGAFIVAIGINVLFVVRDNHAPQYEYTFDHNNEIIRVETK